MKIIKPAGADFLPLLLISIIIIYGVFSRFTVVDHTVVVHPIRADAIDYFAYAKNLSLNSTFSRDREAKNPDELRQDALRAPGFPYFASFFYHGNNFQSVSKVLWAQAVVQCMAFVLLAVFCWISYGGWFTFIISLLAWTHPAFMSINTYYLTESLFLSSLIIVLAAYLLAIKNKFHWSTLILLGISVAISALIRPTMEYYLLFVFAILCIRQRYLLQKLWPALATFLGLISIWKLRNYFAIGGLSNSHLMINALFHGSFPGFMYNNIPESYGIPYRFDPMSDLYYQGVGKTLSLIWHRACEQPFEYMMWFIFEKQHIFWQWNIIGGQGDVFIYPVSSSPINYQGDLRFWHDIHKFLNAPVMVLGVLYSYYFLIKGLIKNVPFDFTYVIASLVVYASLFHIIIAPYPRYGIPFKIFVMMMFLLLIKSFFNKLVERVLSNPAVNK